MCPITLVIKELHKINGKVYLSDPMECYFKNKTLMTSIILVFSSVFASNSIYSQSITMGSIKGKILDKSTKQPLPFANILIANTQTGAVTDN